MENAILVGLSRQVALTRELSVVANNVANINTTGYKADRSLFEEFLATRARDTQSGRRVSFVLDRGLWHDLNQGNVERTGNSLDVAIDGNAFLVVQTPRGERYTRNGSFHINSTGQLVTSEGSPVLGDNGPITLQSTDSQISIASNGTISVREGNSNTDSIRGKLRLVSFADSQQLKKDGGSTFTTTGNAQPQNATTANLIQGSLEKSNVYGVVEMTRLIDISRSYTAVAAMMQQQNDLGETAVNKLADVPV